jgi:microcin C transport system ATP-binding protein
LGNAILRLTPARGPIVFLGQRLDRLRGIELRRARRHVQPVFQDPYGSLNPRMEVGELIAEGLRLHEPRTDIAARVDTILNQVGLDPSIKHRYPHEFSGGQRQRIAIARAMILHPSLVVLDEPTSALDLSVQATVLELLKELQREYRTAYLFISHDLRVVRSMAHQVLVLQKGQVVEQGGAQQIFANPQHPYTKKLFTAAFFAQAF